MGGWKKKEKPLTPEQAIALAKSELAPFWFNSEPLLAAVKTDSGVSVLPLNSGFSQTAWLYAFIDPTEFAGDRALTIVREWYRRYSSHKLGFIVVFRAAAPFAKSAHDFLKKYQIPFPAMYDQDGLFSLAFSMQAWPGVVVQAGNEEIARGSGSSWTDEVEEKVQHFLRRVDPGLSFNLPFSISHPVVGQSRTDFGALKGNPIQSLSKLVELEGNWKEHEDCISTAEASASMTVHCTSSVFSVIARSEIESHPIRLLVEPVDGAMMQEWASETMTIDENGRGVVRIQLFGLYHLLKTLPPDRRSIRLSFPEALTIPIYIYGLRFGEKS